MTKKTNTAFGKALREFRKALDMSQELLAERANLDRTYISLLERGLRSPSFDTILSLGHGLGLPAAALVGRAVEILQDMTRP